MAQYFVDYDLRKRKDYPELIEALKNLGAIRYLKSAWALNHPNTNCQLLRDHLKQFMDTDDGLMVSQVETWAGYGLDADPNDIK